MFARLTCDVLGLILEARRDGRLEDHLDQASDLVSLTDPQCPESRTIPSQVGGRRSTCEVGRLPNEACGPDAQPQLLSLRFVSARRRWLGQLLSIRQSRSDPFHILDATWAVGAVIRPCWGEPICLSRVEGLGLVIGGVLKCPVVPHSAASMDIHTVDEILAEDGDAARHLRLQPLAVLEPQADPYCALLCQPAGTIHASAHRIGNDDQEAVRPMYRSFLQKGVDRHAQLVSTPEYSVPWAVLDEVLCGNLQPPKGCLWALGCESITPDELDAIRDRLTERHNVRLVFEPFDATKRVQKRFVDPLVYVFWTWNTNGEDVLCILVQFKTGVSRDEEHVELTSLYEGTRVYKFDGQANDKISLIGIICSDAFEFTDQHVDQHYSNLLLLHIQLNQRPAQTDYAAYRQRLYSVASNSNVEVVCLNWAASVKIAGGDASPWISITGSAWYVAPRGVDPDDQAVCDLHTRGIYYSLACERRWHGFYLNFAPHALLLHKQRVFATGPQVRAPRIAPHVLERTRWDDESSEWIDDQADDGFETFVQRFDRISTMLSKLCAQSPLAVERALELLEGPKGDVRWFSIQSLLALKAGREESLRRVTVCQESDTEREGVGFRLMRTRRAQTATALPEAGIAWPPGVADLSAGFEYRWSELEPHCNVEPVGGNGEPAALVYLGEDPEPDQVQNVHSGVLKARQIHAIENFAGRDEQQQALSRAADRLCVTYRRNNNLEFHRPSSQASITNPRSARLDDIAGESP